MIILCLSTTYFPRLVTVGLGNLALTNETSIIWLILVQIKSNIQWCSLNWIYFVILQPLSCPTREKEYFYLHQLELIDSDITKYMKVYVPKLTYENFSSPQRQLKHGNATNTKKRYLLLLFLQNISKYILHKEFGVFYIKHKSNY